MESKITDKFGNVFTISEWLQSQHKKKIGAEAINEIQAETKKPLYRYSKVKWPVHAGGVVQTKIYSEVQKEEYAMSLRESVLETMLKMQKPFTARNLSEAASAPLSSVTSILTTCYKDSANNWLLRQQVDGVYEYNVYNPDIDVEGIVQKMLRYEKKQREIKKGAKHGPFDHLEEIPKKKFDDEPEVEAPQQQLPGGNNRGINIDY